MKKPYFEIQDKQIILTTDSSRTFEIDHISNMLDNIFKYSHIPHFVKKRTMLFIGESNIETPTKFGNFTIDFLKSGYENKDIINVYNNYPFRMIAGFENELSKIISLEAFLTHRTDMIILFNSDNIYLGDKIRGMYNSPIYFADFFSEKQLAYKTRNGDYCLADNTAYKQFDGNIQVIDSNEKRFFIIKEIIDGKIYLVDHLYYSINDLHCLKDRNDNNFYLSPFSLENAILDLSKYIVEFSIKIVNDSININLLIYNQDSEHSVKMIVEDYLTDLIEKYNLKKCNLAVNCDIFGEE